MSTQALDHFGRFLMEHFRDKSIHWFDLLAAGHWKAPALQRLQSNLAALNEEQLGCVREAVIATIDTGLHDFLFRLQEATDFDNDVQVVALGQNVVPLSDGLHGELFGHNGWRARFSEFGEHEPGG
jgi:hypothetical protein